MLANTVSEVVWDTVRGAVREALANTVSEVVRGAVTLTLTLTLALTLTLTLTLWQKLMLTQLPEEESGLVCMRGWFTCRWCL